MLKHQYRCIKMTERTKYLYIKGKNKIKKQRKVEDMYRLNDDIYGNHNKHSKMTWTNAEHLYRQHVLRHRKQKKDKYKKFQPIISPISSELKLIKPYWERLCPPPSFSSIDANKWISKVNIA